MSLTPLTFTGVSKFSADFQTILNRTVSIASLPVQRLQNDQQKLLQQKLLVSNLSSSVASLATTVSGLGLTGEQKALSASSSNTAKVVATNISAPAAAVYNITEITSVAKAAAETSVTGYANPATTAVSSTGSVKLIVGSQEYNIDLSSSNNLTALRNTINALGAGVTATVLTTGTGANPYYLSITANETGAKTLELRDDPTGANTNLLTTLNQGANSVFKLNGVDVNKKTTFINDVVPGVTFDIKGTTGVGESVTVTLASDKSKLSNALESFVASYNAVREQVNAQVGQNAGLLSGDILVREVQTRLRSLTSYSASDAGSVRNLGNLGIEFDSSGVASLNSDTFGSLSDTQINEAFTFLGSDTTGFGGLAATLTDISDSVTGLARIQMDKYDETDKRLTQQVEELTGRVTAMQAAMAAKLQIADTLLAGLESQQSVLDASLQSLKLTLYGRNEG